MPVLALGTSAVFTKCASCQAERAVSIGTLVLGDSGFPDVMRLPSCPCGAIELLMRSWDHCPDNLYRTPFARQRRLVNTLAERLKALGQVSPTTRTFETLKTDPPPDLAESTEVLA